MPDPTQVEPTVPDGSGDPDFDAALAQANETPNAETTLAPEPVADPTAEPAAPVEDPDFTFATLENGQREMRLATGQVYRGKDDAELYGQLAKAQIAASRRITELSRTPEPVAPTPTAPTTPEAIDPTSLAILDLIAPALKAKNGAELIERWDRQGQTEAQYGEMMEAQRANMEAANFFRAVPEFSKSQADADRIDQFLQTNGLPFNAQTAEMAYHTLKAKGEMTAAPTTARTTAPKNGMPPPPTGTAPSNTGKGAPTEADLYSMTTEQLAELIGIPTA